MTQKARSARPANIFDVARLAGVSHQTVSRVLNESPSVRDTTRRRVQEAIEQLRYRPNLAARAMVNRRSRNLGLIAPPDRQTTARRAPCSASWKLLVTHVSVSR